MVVYHHGISQNTPKSKPYRLPRKRLSTCCLSSQQHDIHRSAHAASCTMTCEPSILAFHVIWCHGRRCILPIPRPIASYPNISRHARAVKQGSLNTDPQECTALTPFTRGLCSYSNAACLSRRKLKSTVMLTVNLPYNYNLQPICNNP